MQQQNLRHRLQITLSGGKAVVAKMSITSNHQNLEVWPNGKMAGQSVSVLIY
jgi:hypothetical protein